MASTLLFLGQTSLDNNQLFEIDASGRALEVTLSGYGKGVGYINDITAYQGGYLFSAGQTGTSGLWSTDLVSSTASMSAIGPANLDPGNITVLGNTVLFSGHGAGGAGVLYAGNATAGGTSVLAVANGASTGLYPDELVVLGNRVLFSGWDSTGANDLWSSDGTPGGTAPLVVANSYAALAGNSLSNPGLNPTNITVSNGRVYFRGLDSGGNPGLWVSDGTGAGTSQIVASGAGVDGIDPSTSNIEGFNGATYFAGMDSAGLVGLWRTDGTDAGTVELAVAGAWAGGLDPQSLTAFDGSLYFRGTDAGGTLGLWRSDGTAAGTVELAVGGAGPAGLAPISVDASDYIDRPMAVVGNRFYFSGTMPNGTMGLWSSDGTAAGTQPVQVTGAGYGALGLLPSDFVVVDPGGSVPGSIAITPSSADGSAVSEGVVTTPGAMGASVFTTPQGGQSVVVTSITQSDIVISQGLDVITAGGGSDTVYASGSGATVNGGTGNLTFVAGGGNYSAGGGGSTDYLYGGSGQDTLFGASGANSVMVGGTGNTTLVGALGNSALMFGGTGSNVFYGSGGGMDTMVGGTGSNTYWMTNADLAFGGPSSPDTYNTGTGQALVVEGAGNTSIALGGGQLTAFAGTGHDVYTVTHGLGGSAAIIGFKAGDTIVLGSGFTGADLSQALKSATTGSFGTQLHLSDGTGLVLFGTSITSQQLQLG